MSSFKAEKDDEFDGQAVVVELSEDYDRDGTIIGYTTGDEALDDADTVANYINRNGHQPPESMRDELNYTVANGEDF
jgi:hypothetical protein